MGELNVAGTVSLGPNAPVPRHDPFVNRQAFARFLGLAVWLAVSAAFLPVLMNAWVIFDDDGNFLENVDYRGFGGPQIWWAWTTFKLGVYQPLSWMLLELQYLVFGLEPRGYHLTSLLLYGLVAIALYAVTATVLARVVGPASSPGSAAILFASALASALFMVHPLRVEVVAWASCQPYLPCALFCLLSVLAYLRAFRDGSEPNLRWLAAAWALFFAALLSKAVAVTLPVVLIILDIAVLHRQRTGQWRDLLRRLVWREKAPFIALSAIFQVLAILAKRRNESLSSIRDYGPLARVVQACYSTLFYLAKTIWPGGLAAFYPLPRPSAKLLSYPYILLVPAFVGLTLLIVMLRRRWPGLLWSWAAFLVILAPNAGLLRIGNQIAADRYSFLAGMPLVLPASYGLFKSIEWCRGRTDRLAVLAGLCASILLVWSGLSWQLSRTWRDTGSMWTNVYAHYRQNPTVLFNMGMVEERRGRLQRAKEYYLMALRNDPLCADAYNLLGAVLDREGRRDEAFAWYREAVRIEPEYAAAQNNLGSALARQGKLSEARVHFEQAIRLKPDFAMARRNLATALAESGMLRRALVEYAEAARLAPDDAGVRTAYGLALVRAGRLDGAIAQFERAVGLDPNSAAIQVNLGLALDQAGRNGESVARFSEAARLEPGRVDNHLLLASALVKRGELHKAMSAYESALRLDPGNKEAAEGLRDVQRRSNPRPR
jgi:protein O-mannosyl-transferase